MNIREAIDWANEIGRIMTYYVIPFNDGYCTYSETHMKRCPTLYDKSVYDTKTKEIRIEIKPYVYNDTYNKFIIGQIAKERYGHKHHNK